MAGRIRDEDVKTVRDAVPIDSVVAQYLQLRPAGGGNLKGLCPFHDEKSPSFQVSASKGLFYCFGCQEGGDTLDFVMKLDHLTFSEAVERLAAQAGITLRYEDGGYNPARQQGERTRLIEAHKAAARFYTEQLDSAEAEIGRAFLAARGFGQDAAAHFGVGYAPAGWDHLVRYLRGQGFTDKELLTGGLASDGRRGPIDRFRGRLVWPIRDITGEVIGFGARKLRDDDNGPKYLNTPETPLYKKSHVLYGIDLAKKEIGRTGRAVVVEGYTDVMACHLAGVTTAIATCGTAFAGDHVKILRRVLMDSSRNKVIFTFDGDAAGQRAALRAFEDDQKFAAATNIAISPGGMDPCELRLAKGDEAVRQLVDESTPLFEFAIRSATDQHDIDTPEGQAAALEAAAPIVARIKDTAIRHRYAVMLSGLLGYVIENQVAVRRVSQLATWQRDRKQQPEARHTRGQAAAEAPPQAARGLTGPPLNLRAPHHRVERELLKLALQYPQLVAPAFDAYGEDEFTGPPYAAVRRAIAEAGGTEGADADYLRRVSDAAPDNMTRSMITELAVEAVQSKSPDVYAGRILVDVRLQAVKRREAELRSEAARLGMSPDPERHTAVHGELWALQQYGKRLRDQGVEAL
ncbi:DNA primase [Streptantibioticus silvisoli]|uniref:DNA primase n=1 Tax=Streptantibioticus silvisoli TaxID=2705255 RepID=A0ABT6VSL8_9ACTN|nr:DNA primase [Streptantibioticus silvisoli]MDI5961471.1 DNA primase [Streptantibioticus silvisoli]